MYSQLEKMDMVIALPDGERRCIQTDHRTLTEIAEQPELSVLMAMIRVLNPRRAEGAPGVVYLCSCPPLDLLKRAVEAAGGLFARETSEVRGPLPAFDASVAEALFDRTAADLADRIARSKRATISREFLASEEAALLADLPNRDEDETAYWESVLRLGALGAATLKRELDGAWKISSGLGTLPVVFNTVANQQVNFFGKAIKLIANGPEDSLVSLVDAVAAMAKQQ